MRIIAGPCAIENNIQFEWAIIKLLNAGYTHIRGGIWKPRTDADAFSGMGMDAIAIVEQLQKMYDFTFYTEVSNLEQLDQVRKIKANIWIGARSSGDPFTMAQLAEAITPGEFDFIGIKNPIANDSKLWMGAISRFVNKGIKVNPIFRGFINPKSLYRNEPKWDELEKFRKNMGLSMDDIFIDPSHIAGKKDLIKQIIDYSMHLGYKNYIIEAHPSPAHALTDIDQQIDIEHIAEYLHPHAPIEYLRYELDNIDNQIIHLLNSRMQVSKEIGIIKKENNMPITDLKRKSQLINKWGEYNLVYEEIHNLSCKNQKK